MRVRVSVLFARPQVEELQPAPQTMITAASQHGLDEAQGTVRRGVDLIAMSMPLDTLRATPRTTTPGVKEHALSQRLQSRSNDDLNVSRTSVAPVTLLDQQARPAGPNNISFLACPREDGAVSTITSSGLPTPACARHLGYPAWRSFLHGKRIHRRDLERLRTGTPWSTDW
jgi:hypothetical protein